VLLMSIGRAARELGVTPSTVRRWTSTGLLPCVRTAGGHRRIDKADVDHLKRVIGGGHLQARQAREREVETLVEASIALVSITDRQELLLAIARHVTALCDCGSCNISAFDAVEGTVTQLAEYDSRGRPLEPMPDYSLDDYPVTRRVLESQIPVVVNVDDPGADPAEVAILRHYGDLSTLMVPLVFREQTVGLLEAVDWERCRRYSPQELRLVTALASHAAAALHSVELFEHARSHGDPGACVRGRLADLAARLNELGDLRARADWPATAARLVCDVFAGHSCVVARNGVLLGAAMRPSHDAPDRGPADRGAADRGPAESDDTAARVLTRVRDGDAGRYEVTLTLVRPTVDGEAELFDVLVALIAALGERTDRSEA